MTKAQEYAVKIELVLKDIFNCDRFGYGGLVNSDVIIQFPLTAIIASLSNRYKTSCDSEKAIIEEFIKDNIRYIDWSIDYFLSFDTSKKKEGIEEINIPYKNGEEAIKDILEKFREIIYG